MRAKLSVLIAILILTSVAFAQVDLIGAAARGQGGAFVAVANDAHAPVYNPAGMESFRELKVNLSYSNLYLGVNDNMFNEGMLGFVGHLGRGGKYGSYGLSVTHFMEDVYSQTAITLGYAKRLYGTADGAHLALGINGKFYLSSFNDGNASDGFNSTDPLIGESSAVPSADFGLMFVPVDWLSVGVSALDILNPDVSISQSGSDDENIEPMTILGGVSCKFGAFRPSVAVEYVTRELNGSSPMLIHGGLEVALGQAFALRGGYDRNEAAFGFGYKHIGEKVNWGVDYAAEYPLNELGGEFFTSHHIGFGLEVQPPPIPLEDMEIVDGTIEVFPKQLVVANPVTIRAKIVNKSEIKQKKVNITCYYQDDAGMWNHCSEPIRERFELGEEKVITFSWTPPADGHYTIYVTVDDDGTRTPDIRSRIDEFDEENNTGVGECWVYRSPEGIISPRDNRLSVSKLTLYQEEEPIIPVIFFEKNSANIDARYDRTLKIVAERLNKNPDVQLSVKGFYSPGSDTENPEATAKKRAEAVVNALKKHGAPSDRVAVSKNSYDPAESRAGNPEDQFNKKSLSYQLDENRRAEVEAWFNDGSDFLAEIPFTGMNMTAGGKDMISTNVGRMKSLLMKNPEVIILCDAYAEPGDSATAEQVFKKITMVAQDIKGRIEDEELKKRVYIHQSYREGADPNTVMVFPVSEGLVFRPKEADHVIDDYEVESNEMNMVNIDATVQAGVDSFAVAIVDKSGKTIRYLAAGKGQLPEGLAWDWRDNSGELLDFDEKYFAKLEVSDKLGESIVEKSDTMAIKVTKQAKRIESLVIVEFVFDEDTPESKFLSSRVEYVAQRLINRATKGYTKIEATVTGHTDSIGAEYANNALSDKRAKRELVNLRRYMMYLLDLDTQAQLDTWLDKHNVELTYKGYGERNPYEIVRWGNDGTREKVTLGNNSLPEGRTVNRRVLLEMKSTKLGPN